MSDEGHEQRAADARKTIRAEVARMVHSEVQKQTAIDAEVLQIILRLVERVTSLEKRAGA